MDTQQVWQEREQGQGQGWFAQVLKGGTAMHVSNVGAVVGRLASGSHIRQIGIATLLVGASLIGYSYAAPGAGPAPAVSLPAPQPPVAQVAGSDSGKQAVDAVVAERRARAAEIRNEAEDALRAAAVRQEGDMLMHEGRYDAAQALYAESNAIFSGKPAK
ncbi:MAG: hypothetical protein M3380_21710 [Chloroflexota bacterium]|nr:hypothetical protein [Chloroflexota bacterium]